MPFLWQLYMLANNHFSKKYSYRIVAKALLPMRRASLLLPCGTLRQGETCRVPGVNDPDENES